MFTKFAKTQVLEVKSSAERLAAASLTKFADFNDYRTDDGYVYVRVRAISSRVNKNNDGWPAQELQKAWRTFIGKPIFIDHHNSDPKRARGVIVDAALHVEDDKTSALDPYYATAPANHKPPTWIELLLEVDAKKFPRLAKAIVSGEIDSVSMGANVEMSKCSHCGNEAYSPEQFCKHIISKGAYFDYTSSDGVKTSKRSYEDCHNVGFFEISFVFDPADETALVSDIKTSARRQLIASIQHEGGADPFGEGGAYEDPQQGEFADYAAPQESEAERVLTWKYEQYVKMGYPPHQAEQMARSQSDYHDYENVINKGATPDQAHAILAQHTAQNPVPQSEMTTAPEKVDTLRQEQVCPICGSEMEDGICEVCNYEEPPEGFDNPDLQKAKEVDQQIHQQDAQQAEQGQQQQPNDVEPTQGGGPSPMPSGAMPATSKVGAPADVKSEKTSANGKINTQERPILPVTRQLSDKPLNPKTVVRSPKKIESNTKDKDNNEMTGTTKTADGASPQGQGVQADQRVDVLGIGGTSGDPLKGIEHENVESDTGDFTAPHTDTWTGDEGDSLGQQEPVTSEAFEGGGQGTGNAVGVSSPPPHNSAARTADTSGDLGGPIGTPIGEGEGGAEGAKTWDQGAPGFPDHDPARVPLLGELAEEVGDRTRTDSSEEFRSQKHTEPVTKGNDANELGGPIGVAVAKAKATLLKAVKVAEAEISLGLTDADDKFDRISELESAPEEALDAQISTLSKVKTAGLKKASTSSSPAGARSLPSFSKSASFDIEAHGVGEDPFADSIY